MLAPAVGTAGAAGQAALGGGLPGPDGPPTSVSIYNSGNEMNPFNGISWANGDVLAETQSGFSASASVDPTSSWINSAAGNTTQDTTDDTCGRYWYVRHIRNGQTTAWVLGGEGIFCT